MMYVIILIYSLNIRSLVATSVRHPGLQNLYFDFGVCDVHYVPY